MRFLFSFWLLISTAILAQDILIYPSQVTGLSVEFDGSLDDMAITVESTKTLYCDSTPSGASFSHTIDANTDVLVVLIDGWNGSAPITNKISAITWTATGASGQGASGVSGDASDGGANWSDEQLAAYVLADPNMGTASGAGTIAITSTSGTFSEGTQFYAVNLKGVDVTVGTAGMRDSGSNSADSGTSLSETITSVSGDLALAWFYSGDSAVSVDSGQTAVLSDNLCNGAYSSLSYEEATGATINVGYNSISGYSAILALSFAPSAGGASQIDVTDTGAGADAGLDIGAGLNTTDTSVGADLQSVSVGFLTADTGFGADIQNIAANVAETDTGSGVDSDHAITATLDVIDAGTGSDLTAPVVSVIMTITDTWTASELVTAQQIKGILDVAAGNDVVSIGSISTTVIDAGTGIEAISIQAAFQAVDTALGIDQTTISALVSALDAAVGVDVATAYTLISVLDSGAASDILSIGAQIPVVDVGAGTDNLVISATFTVSDISSAADIIAKAIATTTKSIIDSASGIDSIGAISAHATLTDVAVGSDATVISLRIATTDIAAAVDTVATAVFVATAELGSGSDASPSVTATIQIPDTATASEVTWIYNYLRALDSAEGVDIATAFDAAIRLVSIVATYASRTITPVFAQRLITPIFSFRKITGILET